MTTLSQKPSVKLVDGKPTTTSQQVAKFFRKDHWRVLRAIENLECSPQFHATNFGVMQNPVQIGNNAIRNDKAYIITKDGFMFLAMGFTGKEAAQWKEKFIEAFNALEQQAIEKLKPKTAPKALPPNHPKRYNYPRYLLEQEYFTSPSRHAPLNISMLGHEKEFSSSLLQLLLELRMDGNNVDAPYDEFIAMREGMIKARRALDEIMHTALRASGQPASTAVRS